MEYHSDHRKEHSQNFLKNSEVVRAMIRLSQLSTDTLILDIGVGRGIITKALLQQGYRVQGYEIDSDLIEMIQYPLQHPRFTFIQKDILLSPFPAQEFGIISNPPFQIFSQLIKKLYQSKHTPEEFIMIGQKEAVKRVMGIPHHSLMSVMLNSLYQCDIPIELARGDFTPKPNVDIVILRGIRIPTSLWSDVSNFEDFVRQGFMGNKANLGKNLSATLSFEQWKRLSKTYKFSVNSLPSELTIHQWKSIWQYYKTQ